MSKFPEIKVEMPDTEDGSLSSCASSEPFALQVLGDSMEPEFPNECVVVIEPNDECRSGAYVMAEVENSYWFRRYLNDDNGERLVALNRDYPEIPLDDMNWKIVGVIVQRNIRREVKHYENF